jgi:hypothetical protein
VPSQSSGAAGGGDGNNGDGNNNGGSGGNGDGNNNGGSGGNGDGNNGDGNNADGDNNNNNEENSVCFHNANFLWHTANQFHRPKRSRLPFLASWPPSVLPLPFFKSSPACRNMPGSGQIF